MKEEIAPQQPQADGEQKCAFCGWKKKDHRLNCCYHYSDEDTDYFYKDKFFKPMTQSDAPNEGREENGIDIICQVCELNNAIHYIEDKYFCCGCFTKRVAELRDQLSKEREKVERLEQWKKEEMEIWGPVLDYMQDGGSGKRGPIGASISELVLQILKHHYEGKEREMRKELVKGVENIISQAKMRPSDGTLVEIRKLIAKASELDKNE